MVCKAIDHLDERVNGVGHNGRHSTHLCGAKRRRQRRSNPLPIRP